MQPANSRRQQQREQHRERDRFQHRARKIKPRYHDRADDDARHAADRALLGAVTALEPRRRLAALVLHPPLHERRTGRRENPPMRAGMAGIGTPLWLFLASSGGGTASTR